MEVQRREVSASPEEFLRGVHAAFPGQVNETADRVRVDDGSTAMEITLVPGPPRIFGSLNLPTLRVTIRFLAGTPAQQASMLAHMDRAMHRGGG
jgi:hypothetical protein